MNSLMPGNQILEPIPSGRREYWRSAQCILGSPPVVSAQRSITKEGFKVTWSSHNSKLYQKETFEAELLK